MVKASLLLLALSLACGGREPADAVLIVDGENVAVRGQVQIEFSPDGGMEPVVWVPGNVVIFRNDQELRGQPGKGGRAYRITEGDALEEIGEVDLSKSDDELAEEFGIEPAEAAPAEAPSAE